MLKFKIGEWYTNKFLTDELGEEIRNDVTFEGLLNTLDNNEDVYNYVGVYDSIVRERMFEKLSEILNVDYNYIYDKWLNAVD